MPPGDFPTDAGSGSASERLASSGLAADVSGATQPDFRRSASRTEEERDEEEEVVAGDGPIVEVFGR
jgi:hypothetical protein